MQEVEISEFSFPTIFLRSSGDRAWFYNIRTALYNNIFNIFVSSNIYLYFYHMKEQILNLRKEGKTYNEIIEIVGCSKSTVSYHCGEKQKEKSKNRRNRLKLYGPLLKKKNNCINCNKDIANKKKYCDNKCQNDYINSNYIKDWLSGNNKGWVSKSKTLSKTIRNWLKKTRGSGCEECGWDGKHPLDNKSVTEIDHIDGNAENCRPENLKILCPNCHAMTPTYRNRNTNCTRSRYNKDI